jgi:23S rRNA (uracil1939-C5)-methyltransferase
MSAPTTTRPERGQELDLRVDALAYGGNGVARLEGYVVFVNGAVPGDRVRAVVTKRKRGYAEARTLEILEPSPERIEPVAPGHPGTPWQVLPYERQLEVKAEQVGDALRRIGRLEGFEQEPIVPAEEGWRYRNKVEYSFGTGDDGALVCGFHKPGSWEEIVHVEDDLLASEAVNVLRRRVVDWARDRGLGAYDRRSQEASCATSSSARAGAPATCSCAWSPASSRPRRSTRPRSRRPSRRRRLLDADPRRGRDDRRRRDRPPHRRAAAARGARRPRVPDLARGVLPDEHR